MPSNVESGVVNSGSLKPGAVRGRRRCGILVLNAMILAGVAVDAADMRDGTITGQITYGPKGKPVPHAIVYLGARTRGADQPAAVAVNVVNGRLQPRIQIAHGGADLVLGNSDPTLYVVRLEWIGQGSTVRPLQRVAMPYAGFRKRFRLPQFDQTRLLQVVGDNGETKLRGYVALLPHPYAAVTDRDGRFEIGRVPSNRYPVHVWHERLGALADQCVVRPRQRTTLALGYR